MTHQFTLRMELYTPDYQVIGYTSGSPRNWLYFGSPRIGYTYMITKKLAIHYVAKKLGIHHVAKKLVIHQVTERSAIHT